MPEVGRRTPRLAHGAVGSELTMPAAKLLMTLLGDYWFASREPIPSSALVDLLAQFGVSPDAARGALSRLTRDGRIERSKDGRRTAYRVAAAARDRALERGRALVRFGAEPIDWDGQWTCVAFSVPESDRRRRWLLRSRLRELRMGRLYDGLWISPHDLADPVDAALGEIGIRWATILRATELRNAGGVDPVDAWELDRVRTSIDDVDQIVVAIRRRLDEGSVGPADALVARTDLMARWRTMAAADPYLPEALLPDDWPLTPARRRFADAYDALGPLSELRVRQLVGMPADRAGGPRHHRFDDLT
jgi:phenylacetic acid degradation operon negative regulatory protein